MRYPLLLLVVGLLFLRPSELIEELAETQLYEAAILACLATSALPVARRLLPGALVRQPITPCLLVFAATVVLSHLVQFEVGEAAAWGLDVFKVLVLFLLVVANLDTPGRVRNFLGWMGVLILIVAVLAILQFHDAIAIPALAPFQQKEYDAATGELLTTYPRMVGPGIFHDPNDLCLVLALGIVVSLNWLSERKLGGVRFVWLAPLGICAYGAALTLSRGGMLAVLAGLAAVAGGRFGIRKALALAILLLPLLILVLASRSTRLDITDDEDTSQTRMRLWSEALVLFRESPLTGIGAGQFVEQTGAVAHNSFLHAFAEVGFIGGSAFLGAFALGLVALRSMPGSRWRRAARAASNDNRPSDVGRLLPAAKPIARLKPFIWALLASFAVGLLSLSRPYSPMTYLMLGLITAYVRLAERVWPGSTPRLTVRTIAGIMGLGIGYLVAMRLFVAIFVRWSAGS